MTGTGRPVHQLLAALSYGDAISNEALAIQAHLRRLGHPSDIFAEGVHPRMAHLARPLHEYPSVSSPETVCLFHFSIGSAAGRLAFHAPDRLVAIYHNITPAHFFVRYDPEMVHICTLGRTELTGLAGHVDLALGDSEFNRRELEDAGFARTGVLPIYLDFDRYRETPNAVLRRLLDDGRTNVLFVGRIAPNKRQDDLVRMASYWKRFIGPDVRLLLVGKPPRRRHYFDALQSLYYEEHFTPWEVLLPGHVSHDDLLAYYASAHVFVSASDHEGFGVPLVESMLMDVPVVAYRTTAVGDTLGDAGIQFAKKRLDLMAEAAAAVARPGPLREGVLARQRERVRDFAPEAVERILRGHLESL